MSEHDMPFESESLLRSFMNNFGVSCLSASIAHIPHHPLYTLKSQMMFRGQRFNFRHFLNKAWTTKGRFLFQGKYIITLYIMLARGSVLLMCATMCKGHSAN